MLVGRIDYQGLPSYSGGFGYQLHAIFVTYFAGSVVSGYQLVLHPFFGLFTILILFVALRRILSDDTMAVVACGVYSLYPYAMFELTRGSHLSLSLALVMLIMLSLANLTYRRARGRWQNAVVLYLCIFATATFNVFFALSVLLGTGMTFLAVFALRRGSESMLYRRWGWSTLFGAIILSTVVLFLYQPALTLLSAMRTAFDVFSLLLNSFGEQAVPSAYATGAGIWTSIQVYLILLLYEILVLPLALVSWIAFTAGVIKRRPSERHWFILWALAGCFGFQVALSFLFDRIGGFGAGNNLSLRLLPVGSVFFIPWTLRSLGRLRHLRLGIHGTAIRVGVAVALILVLATVAPLRAYVDPTVAPASWIQSTVRETASAQWIETNVPRGSTISVQPLYSGNPENRLRWIYQSVASPPDFAKFVFTSKEVGQYYYTSDIERERALYVEGPTFAVDLWSTIYDNGDVQVMHQWSDA